MLTSLINLLYLMYKEWKERREHVGEREAARSREWPKTRREHIKKEPLCRWCGRKTFLNVHHIEPFHLNPELELNDSNLITLCEGGIKSVIGTKEDTNCHLHRGHLGNWKGFNPRIREECLEHGKKKENA